MTGAAKQALEMLDAFASVGAERFDITFTDIAGGKVGFRGNRPLAWLRPAIAGMLNDAAELQHNVIVRPRPGSVALIQLDDLDQDAAARLLPLSFLVLSTSPGNDQAWVAVADVDADFPRRLRKGTGADLSASGATRVSGSLNFKEKYIARFPSHRDDSGQPRPGGDARQARSPGRCSPAGAASSGIGPGAA